MSVLIALYIILGCFICWKNNLRAALPYLGLFLSLQFSIVLLQYSNEILFIYLISFSLQFLVVAFFSQAFPRTFSIHEKKSERMFLGPVAVLGGAVFFGVIYYLPGIFSLKKLGVLFSIESIFIKYASILVISIALLMILLDQIIKGENKWNK